MAHQSIQDAVKAREDSEKEFNSICEEARQSPVAIEVFVKHRVAYMKTCEDVYAAMWYGMADTGVQVLRQTGKVTDIKINPK